MALAGRVLTLSFLTSLHNQFRNRGFLTPKQLTFLRKKMVKYAGQILRITPQDKLEAIMQKQLSETSKIGG